MPQPTDVATREQASLLDPMPELEHDAELSALIADGDASIASIRSSPSPRVFIISGPSGVGKDTVLEQLRDYYPQARYVVTSTSRPRRSNEIDGVHYAFLEKATFERAIEAGEYIESELVYGNLYGVPRRPIVEGLAEGRHVIIKVDVKGAATLRRLIANTISIFLLPESMETLLDFLCNRKTEPAAVIRKRFHTAREEIDRVGEFDYTVFNRSRQLEETLAAIRSIIEAEQRRVDQPPILLPPPVTR